MGKMNYSLGNLDHSWAKWSKTFRTSRKILSTLKVLSTLKANNLKTFLEVGKKQFICSSQRRRQAVPAQGPGCPAAHRLRKGATVVLQLISGEKASGRLLDSN